MFKIVIHTLLFAAILAACVVFRTPLLRAYHLATGHVQEPYSELYFSDSTKLPVQTMAGKTYTYSVHVTNHEAKTRTYHLVAKVEIPGRPAVVTNASLQLHDGQGADKKFSFTIPGTQETAIVTVLMQPNEQYIKFKSQS